MNQNCLFGNLTDSTPNPGLIGVGGKNHAAFLDCVRLSPEDGDRDIPFPGHTGHSGIPFSPGDKPRSRERISLPIVTHTGKVILTYSALSF